MRISIYIPDGLKSKLDLISESTGESVSTICRDAVKFYLPLLEAAENQVIPLPKPQYLIGLMKSGPSTPTTTATVLSTKPTVKAPAAVQALAERLGFLGEAQTQQEAYPSCDPETTLLGIPFENHEVNPDSLDSDWEVRVEVKTLLKCLGIPNRPVPSAFDLGGFTNRDGVEFFLSEAENRAFARDFVQAFNDKASDIAASYKYIELEL